MFMGTLGLSIAIHATVFLLISMPQSPLKPPPFKKPIEIAYRGMASKPQPQEPQREYTKFETQKPKLPKLNNLKPSDIAIKQQETIRKDIFKETPIKKTVNIPNIPGEVFKTPEYKSYYQLIREKIRKYAYFNYKRLNEGEVFLTFSLTDKGELLDFTINEQKSTDNEYLRSIAENSVKEAAPFQPFPEKLKENKKLSFNVIISFELK